MRQSQVCPCKICKTCITQVDFIDPILTSDLFSSKIIPVLVRLVVYTAYHSISPYSVRMREYTDQNYSEYEHFLRSYTLHESRIFPYCINNHDWFIRVLKQICRYQIRVFTGALRRSLRNTSAFVLWLGIYCFGLGLASIVFCFFLMYIIFIYFLRLVLFGLIILIFKRS